MFKLINKLAVSNLIKNRKLYYPFALATCISVAITYIFYSLTFNPNLPKLEGAGQVLMVLGLGIVIVNISVYNIVLYANGFVMKNRSKELGLYGMLGLNKRHLFLMVFTELFLFGIVTVILGVILGIFFDNLFYALLLKLMGLTVVLASTIQLPVIIFVFITYIVIFLMLVIANGWRIFRFNPLQLSKEKNSGEKKSRFLVLKAIIGLCSLSFGYYLALSVTNPLVAIVTFFVAVLFVILGTYLLFSAGITVFLKLLQKNKRYYYQPNNFISVSNLVFRMKKNAMGLATISILSTMVLVTLVGGANLYAGKDYMQKMFFPQDISIYSRGTNDRNPVTKEQMNQLIAEFASENHLEVQYSHAFQIETIGIKERKGNQFQFYSKDEVFVTPNTYALLFSSEDYQSLTGEDLKLSDNEALVFTKGIDLGDSKHINLDGQDLEIRKKLKENFLFGHVPDDYSIIIPQSMYIVLNNPEKFVENYHSSFNGSKSVYGGLNVKGTLKEKMKLNEALQEKLNQFNQTLPETSSGVYGSERESSKLELNGALGSLIFIGLFLSLVFMMGAVLVIYYKQISEGYEDRERFVILQKVGLDEKQTRKTIHKQVLTVFFLPLIFSFIHLTFAYHMISLILRILGVLNTELALIVTLLVCFVFFVIYVTVFLITSRSYRKIVSL
ncbi:MAG: ABC transporter permease [Streptococcus sp.]|nr:ABC transporter permease [Streptococcus sp.]